MKVILQFDGAAKGNPGPAAAAFVILEDGEEKWHEARVLPATVEKRDGYWTNNEAEYVALVDGLLAVNAYSVTSGEVAHIDIQGDSKLVLEQVAGNWKCKAVNLWSFRDTCQEMVRHFRSLGIAVTFTHIGWQQNMRADQLCNEALGTKSKH